jgi:hypothetical protein
MTDRARFPAMRNCARFPLFGGVGQLLTAKSDSSTWLQFESRRGV